jgi:hypothetical protein
VISVVAYVALLDFIRADLIKGSNLFLTHESFPFDKTVSGMVDPEMIEDTAKIANEAINRQSQVNLIINNRAGGNAPLLAQKITARLHPEKPQRIF